MPIESVFKPNDGGEPITEIIDDNDARYIEDKLSGESLLVVAAIFKPVVISLVEGERLDGDSLKPHELESGPFVKKNFRRDDGKLGEYIFTLIRS